jgi:hypothetical protein
VAAARNEGVDARSAVEAIVAALAEQHVVAVVPAIDPVFAIPAGDHVLPAATINAIVAGDRVVTVATGDEVAAAAARDAILAAQPQDAVRPAGSGQEIVVCSCDAMRAVTAKISRARQSTAIVDAWTFTPLSCRAGGSFVSAPRGADLVRTREPS